jgi:hypothetical protein
MEGGAPPGLIKTLGRTIHEHAAKIVVVTDFVLRVNANPHDQAENLGRIAPAKPITLATDRQVVFDRMTPTELAWHNMTYCLPVRTGSVWQERSIPGYDRTKTGGQPRTNTEPGAIATGSWFDYKFRYL